MVVSSSEMTKSRADHPTNKVPATVSAVNDVRNRGAFVTCKDLAYSVKSSKFRKTWITIVQNVSFYLAPRELTAIIGPSGCGKRHLYFQFDWERVYMCVETFLGLGMACPYKFCPASS